MLQISNLAEFPGCAKTIERRSGACPDRVTFKMNGVLNHSLELFSEDPICVNESSCSRMPALKDLAAKAGLSLPKNYLPIDWHTDFASGLPTNKEEFI